MCKKAAAAVVVFALVCIVMAGGVLVQQRAPAYSMFCWGTDNMRQENRKALDQVIKDADIDEIYQEFPQDEAELEQTDSFLKNMNRQDIAVYALLGEAKWAYEEDGESLIAEIERIQKLRKTLENGQQIQGIMVDVEPYVLDEWDGGTEERSTLMRRYLSGIAEAYGAAKDCGLELLVCIPVFYNATCPEVLEALVSEHCDGIAVMNYSRENEYEQMEEEVNLARQYQKRIICIYELQQPGKHDLTDINTYYHAGLKVLWASRETLEQQFAYDRLSFSYHYYDPLRELLEQLPR